VLQLNSLPVAIIGAGPIGLAAAAHLIRRGETPLVLEAGDGVGANLRKWAADTPHSMRFWLWFSYPKRHPRPR
jgi:cation diffusion facilitator CzcD-associated flavoprotein CzcO